MALDHENQSGFNPRVEVGLQDSPVSVTVFAWPEECGAETVFLGRTRSETHPDLGPLVRLEYEAYKPMAKAVLDQMATDAGNRFGCRAIRIYHAIGPIEPGEASVVIQVATPHRGAAFDACRYLIDRLKRELPIWKREIWRDGETFVEGCCVEHGESST